MNVSSNQRYFKLLTSARAPVAEALACIGIGSGRTRWCCGGRLAGRGPGKG
jgi:hypothetical protein